MYANSFFQPIVLSLYIIVYVKLKGSMDDNVTESKRKSGEL